MSSSSALRLWPGIAAAALIVLMRFVIPAVLPDALILGVITSLAGTVVILLWWLLFSRAPWSERLGAIVVMVAAAVAMWPFLHKSITGGLMGRMYLVYALPAVLGPAFVAWAIVSRRLSKPARWATMVVAIVLACGLWTLFRTDGVVGASSQLTWRWTPTAEERLLAQERDTLKPLPPADDATKAPAAPTDAPAPIAPAEPSRPANATASPASSTSSPVVAPASDPVDPTPARIDWPGFRGTNRDGVVRGVRIETDWAKSAPAPIWQRPIGPGWSSVAVAGDLLYTQEQRGEEEIVACYRVSTGEPVWRHRDAARFWESNGGAGPRGTPTLVGGRVYAFGATGILNALDARTGKVVWTRNVATDMARAVPTWGFSSSPLVMDDVVMVAASGTLAGYDLVTGNKRWVAPPQRGSYSSPHRATIDGVPQVLLLNGAGVASIDPATGQLLWKHDWEGGTPIVQPALTADGDILINSIAMTGGAGLRRLAVARKAGAWTVEERWTSIGLKPYFNDFVVHKGHAYGFDGNILSAISLDDGARKWKGGRYGNGQMLLLADQDLLLVLAEEGDVALVRATPDQYRELARVPAIEGKTWNHPVVVGNTLLLRNGEVMAAFRLAPESR